jgi:hypothetical protein
MKAVDYNLVDHKDVLKQIKDIFVESIKFLLYRGVWHPDDRAKFKDGANICTVNCKG